MVSATPRSLHAIISVMSVHASGTCTRPGAKTTAVAVTPILLSSS